MLQISKKYVNISFVMFAVVISILVCYYSEKYSTLNISTYLMAVVTFFIGLWFGQDWDRKITKQRYKFLTVSMLILNVLRLLLIYATGHGYGGDLLERLYTHFYVGISQCVFALWIITTIYVILRKKAVNPAAMRCVKWLDSISFEVYLVHNVLLYGSWSFVTLTPFIPANALLFFGASIVMAMVLHMLSGACKRMISREA